MDSKPFYVKLQFEFRVDDCESQEEADQYALDNVLNEDKDIVIMRVAGEYSVMTGKKLQNKRKKVKKNVPEVEGSTSTGWMSPTGNYFPTAGNMLHKEIAEQIWVENYPANTQSTETWATVQTDLMRLGWLRFDYSDVEFMRRPTNMQREAIEQILEWKLKNPKAWTALDMGAYEKMQRICMWLSGDVTDDFADLEEEIEKC